MRVFPSNPKGPEAPGPPSVISTSVRRVEYGQLIVALENMSQRGNNMPRNLIHLRFRRPTL